jgi:hypothetical protein
MFIIPVFWFLIAFILAGLECEIEGPNGWASDLPTCRIENRWISRALRPLFGSRPITLYHCFLFSLVTLLCHVGYVQGVSMTWTNEFRILSTLFLLCLTWDFLWFILNPAFGLEKFNRDAIPWHAHHRWFWGIPIDYIVAFVLSFASSTSSWIIQDATILDVMDDLIGFLVWAFLLGIATDTIGPKYRQWRSKKKPERDHPTSP